MIYFMRAGDSGHVKIGWTRDHGTLDSRKASLQTGQPHPLIVLRTIDDAPRWAEEWLHGFFAGVRAAGEWFEFRPEMLTLEPPDKKPAKVFVKKVAKAVNSSVISIRVPLHIAESWRRAAKKLRVPLGRYVFGLAMTEAINRVPRHDLAAQVSALGIDSLLPPEKPRRGSTPSNRTVRPDQS